MRRPASDRLYVCGFRISFTPRTGVLFTCPSRYSSTIGHLGVFRLGGWSPRLHARLLESGVTQELHYDSYLVSPTGLSPSLARRSRRLRIPFLAASVGPTTPPPQGGRFGLCPFRSPLLGASRLISLPAGTEMFQFPAFASHAYGFSMRSFGYPGIKALLTAPPGFSQSYTPFFASWCQGIPHTPFLACTHRPQPPEGSQSRPHSPRTPTRSHDPIRAA